MQAAGTHQGGRQQALFEAMHQAYEAHYYDPTSLAYREEFILRPMLDGLDLNDLAVAELASGSGHNSLSLKALFPRVRLTGFDISQAACDDYERRVEAPCHRLDLTRPAEPASVFDVAFVIGGLHHCVVDLDTTLANVARMLKPGGLFLMLEPNSRHMLEAVRRVWYRLDASFDHATEHALDHEALLAAGHGAFEAERVTYFGGPAYFLILNSMVLRVPLWAKPWIAPGAMVAERLWNRLPGARWHNVFLARWRRR